MTPDQAQKSRERYLVLDHESGYHDHPRKPNPECPECLQRWPADKSLNAYTHFTRIPFPPRTNPD